MGFPFSIIADIVMQDLENSILSTLELIYFQYILDMWTIYWVVRKVRAAKDLNLIN